MVATFRALTPPKYAATLGERKQRLLLEERLAHFMHWLREEHFISFSLNDVRIDDDQVQALIEEYVNS